MSENSCPCDSCPSDVMTECYNTNTFYCDKFEKWVNDWVEQRNKELEAQKG